MIWFEHLTYSYPNAVRPALVDISLEIDEGEFVLLAGPSGAGKSTLLRCLNGLVPHFSGGVVRGHAQVAGLDPIAQGPHVLSRQVGFVFQDPEAQFVVDRVEAEVAFALENAAVHPDEMRQRVEEALALVDLLPLRDRPLDTLSGGEKQRVAIAAALAFQPRVLALDEPTSQLDPQSAEDLLMALLRLNRDLGLTVLLSEHRLERVLPFCDRLLYLSQEGVLEQDGHPQKVLPHISLTPPLVTVGKALGWNPLPLTIQEGQRLARKEKALLAQVEKSVEDGRAVERALPATGLVPAVELSGLYAAYGGTLALEDVFLSILPGELVALIGRNGAGKSTLLNCIVGLHRPERGEIRVAGESVLGRETAEICRAVAYLPQDPNALLFADTVRQELVITLHNHGLTAETSPISPSELLDFLGLAELAESYPRDLSVGQRQRVALGAVTVTRPGLLLLDEPTRGMDYSAKSDLAELLRRWQAAGAGVLLVTHDVELVAQVADRVLVLSHGKIVDRGNPATVLEASPHFAPQVSRLFPGSGWLTPKDVVLK